MAEAIIIVICLIFNALFAAYEMAFVSVPRPELRSLARKGSKSAQRLLALRENPERTLSIMQIGITLVGAIAAAVGGVGATESLEPFFRSFFNFKEITAEILAVITIVIPITYLNVVIGELVPKTLALRKPMKVVLAGSGALFLADRLLAPLVDILEWSTKAIISIFFKRSKAQEPPPQTTIDIEGFSPVHQTLMLTMADIENKRIRDILLPWEQVNFIRSTDSVQDVLQVVLNSGHTRLPVIDNGRILGILHTKEFMALKESGETHWLPIVRPTLRVLANDSALGVLRLMQEKRSHMAIVFGGSGEKLGIVTLEDIMEEIVGEIYDEDDDGKARKIFASRVKTRMVPRQRP